jgi:hypothetical protein
MNDSSPDLSSAPNLSENDSQEKSLPSQAPETPKTPLAPSETWKEKFHEFPSLSVEAALEKIKNGEVLRAFKIPFFKSRP